MKTLFFFLVIFSNYCLAQNQNPFKTCTNKVYYTVDDWVLRKKVGMDLNFPDCSPTYDGGVEELKKFFRANSIDDSIYLFRTAISFVVNCKGQVGNFQFLYEGKADSRQEQVLDLVKKMPRKWKPAISKEGKPVDSYQIIILTTKGSKIIDVEYK